MNSSDFDKVYAIFRESVLNFSFPKIYNYTGTKYKNFINDVLYKKSENSMFFSGVTNLLILLRS